MKKRAGSPSIMDHNFRRGNTSFSSAVEQPPSTSEVDTHDDDDDDIQILEIIEHRRTEKVDDNRRQRNVPETNSNHGQHAANPSEQSVANAVNTSGEANSTETRSSDYNDWSHLEDQQLGLSSQGFKTPPVKRADERTLTPTWLSENVQLHSHSNSELSTSKPATKTAAIPNWLSRPDSPPMDSSTRGGMALDEIFSRRNSHNLFESSRRRDSANVSSWGVGEIQTVNVEATSRSRNSSASSTTAVVPDVNQEKSPSSRKRTLGLDKEPEKKKKGDDDDSMTYAEQAHEPETSQSQSHWTIRGFTCGETTVNPTLTQSTEVLTGRSSSDEDRLTGEEPSVRLQTQNWPGPFSNVQVVVNNVDNERALSPFRRRERDSSPGRNRSRSRSRSGHEKQRKDSVESSSERQRRKSQSPSRSYTRHERGKGRSRSPKNYHHKRRDSGCGETSEGKGGKSHYYSTGKGASYPTHNVNHCSGTSQRFNNNIRYNNNHNRFKGNHCDRDQGNWGRSGRGRYNPNFHHSQQRSGPGSHKWPPKEKRQFQKEPYQRNYHDNKTQQSPNYIPLGRRRSTSQNQPRVEPNQRVSEKALALCSRSQNPESSGTAAAKPHSSEQQTSFPSTDSHATGPKSQPDKILSERELLDKLKMCPIASCLRSNNPFGNREDMKKHLKDDHRKDICIICLATGKEQHLFPAEEINDDLSKHFRSDHADKVTFKAKCIFCAKHFKKKGYYQHLGKMHFCPIERPDEKARIKTEKREKVDNDSKCKPGGARRMSPALARNERNRSRSSSESSDSDCDRINRCISVNLSGNRNNNTSKEPSAPKNQQRRPRSPVRTPGPSRQREVLNSSSGTPREVEQSRRPIDNVEENMMRAERSGIRNFKIPKKSNNKK